MSLARQPGNPVDTLVGDEMQTRHTALLLLLLGIAHCTALLLLEQTVAHTPSE